MKATITYLLFLIALTSCGQKADVSDVTGMWVLTEAHFSSANNSVELEACAKKWAYELQLFENANHSWCNNYMMHHTTGCNDINGCFNLDADSIYFSGFRINLSECEDTKNIQGVAYGILGRAVGYLVDGQFLTLTNPSNGWLFKYEFHDF